MLGFSLRPEETMRAKNATAYEYMYAEYPFLRPWTDSLERAGALRDTVIVRHHMFPPLGRDVSAMCAREHAATMQHNRDACVCAYCVNQRGGGVAPAAQWVKNIVKRVHGLPCSFVSI